MPTDEEISPLVKRILAEDYGVKQGYDAIAYIGVSLASLAKLEKLAREDVLKNHENHDYCEKENCAACYLLDKKEKEIQKLKEANDARVFEWKKERNELTKRAEKAEDLLNKNVLLVKNYAREKLEQKEKITRLENALTIERKMVLAQEKIIASMDSVLHDYETCDSWGAFLLVKHRQKRADKAEAELNKATSCRGWGN